MAGKLYVLPVSYGRRQEDDLPVMSSAGWHVHLDAFFALLDTRVVLDAGGRVLNETDRALRDSLSVFLVIGLEQPLGTPVEEVVVRHFDNFEVGKMASQLHAVNR